MSKVGRPKKVLTDKQLKGMEKCVDAWGQRVIKGMKALLSPAFK